jgi:hypothetical protein
MDFISLARRVVQTANIFTASSSCALADGTALTAQSIGQWALTAVIGVITSFTGARSSAVTKLQFCNAAAWRLNKGFPVRFVALSTTSRPGPGPDRV